MTANASKNKETANTIMSPAAGKISESVLALMQVFGIQKLECKKLKAADFERIVASSVPFNGIPAEISNCGMLVKNALAEILASAGVVGLEIAATEEEVQLLCRSYETMVSMNKAAEAATAGSSDTAAGKNTDQGIVDKSSTSPAGTCTISQTMPVKEEKEKTSSNRKCKAKSCRKTINLQ